MLFLENSLTGCLYYMCRGIRTMTIRDIAKKYNISYGGNVSENKDGSIRIGNLYLTERAVTKDGSMGSWIIPLEEGLQVLFEKASGIWLDLTNKEIMSFLKDYLISKGYPKDRILE